MSRVVNLTPDVLRRIIAEEKKKLVQDRAKKAKLTGKSREVAHAAKETKEVEASDMAHTLAKEVQHYKQMQEAAARLARKLSEINEARQELRARILEQL